MKTISKYQEAKRMLKMLSIEVKQNYPNDKPYIRMIINDEVDFLSKDLNLSDYQRNLLSNYACKLHPN